MNEFVSIISRSLHKNIPKIIVPPFLLNFGFKINSKLLKLKKIKRLEKTVEKWLSDDVYTAKKIAEAYNFRAETTIRVGVERQVEHYKARKGK